MVAQNHNATEVGGKNLLLIINRKLYKGLAFHIQLYLDDELCHKDAEGSFLTIIKS